MSESPAYPQTTLAGLSRADRTRDGVLPLRFEDHVLDHARRELTRAGRRIVVEPRVFDLLVYLIEKRDRLVSKDDLISAIWSGRIVSDSAVTNAVNAARNAIADDGRQQRLIRTIARKGYRFIGSVVQRSEAGSAMAAAAVNDPASPSLALPDKPSIAVLRFRNIGGDPEQACFADGVVEDIVTALSRFKSLFVIARNSGFTPADDAIDIEQVGRELGVRYVLQGSVRKAGGRIRITGQLIDSRSGAHLWADRFDGPLEDIFGLQDQVTMSIVGAIVPTLNSAELKRVRRTPVESLDAHSCFLHGNTIFRRFTREACAQALDLYYRAIALDPDFATPYGLATHFYASSKLQGWSFDREQAEAEVRRLSERVSALGQNDAWALCTAGFSLAWVCREFDAGASFVDKAILINPNLTNAWMQGGAVSTFRGEHPLALERFARARRLSPLGTDFHLSQGYASIPCLFTRRYEEAARRAVDAASHLPNWLVGPLVIAAVNGLTGNVGEARRGLEQLHRIRPDLRLSNLGETFTYRRPEDLSQLANGHRLAGLPE